MTCQSDKSAGKGVRNRAKRGILKTMKEPKVVVIPAEKRCPGSGDTKHDAPLPASAFSLNSKSPDGLNHKCKECRKKERGDRKQLPKAMLDVDEKIDELISYCAYLQSCHSSIQNEQLTLRLESLEKKWRNLKGLVR